jgi:hypothetical protein
VIAINAFQAGIIGTNLSIALEPECAAIYCSQLPVNQLEIQGDSGKLKYVAAPDSTIMVVDLGGKTNCTAGYFLRSPFIKVLCDGCKSCYSVLPVLSFEIIASNTKNVEELDAKKN